MVESVDEQGVFWLPEAPDDRRSGRLIFDPAENIRVSLLGSFEPFPASGVDDERVIHGEIGGKEVTLLDAWNLSERGQIRTYHVDKMLIGHHLDGNSLKFHEVSVKIFGLTEWVRRTAIAEEYHYRTEEKPAFARYEARLRIPDPESADFGRGKISLHIHARHHGDSLKGVQLSSEPVLSIKYEDLTSLHKILSDIRRIQDLVTLCLDVRTFVDSLTLRRFDIRHRIDLGEDGPLKSIEFRAPIHDYVPQSERREPGRVDTLLSYQDLGGLQSVALWLDRSEPLQTAINALMSVKNTARTDS
jgi:hypothetical protein